MYNPKQFFDISKNLSFNICKATQQYVYLNHARTFYGISKNSELNLHNLIYSSVFPLPKRKQTIITNIDSKNEIDNQKESLSKYDKNSIINSGPGLGYFISNLGNRVLTKREVKKLSHPYVKISDTNGNGQKVFFKVYGCQMNSNDTEIAWSILKDHNYALTEDINDADVILIVTCAIREGAEDKIWRQLKALRRYKLANHWNKSHVKVGVLGCMAERIGSEIIEKEKAVDIVAGPDSYRDLPRLLAIAHGGERTVNILLSHDETYASVNPVSLSQNRISAYVSIMRGCNNMCSYCIVPFTRGKERSRKIDSVVDEVRYLSDQGIKEIILLGQNVNSYRDESLINHMDYITTNNENYLSKGFKTIYKNREGGKRFADLLDKVADVNPEMRIRFTSPHPKDFPDEVLYMIRERPNICCNIHLPAQSGNNRILDLMKRGYTQESYIELVNHIRSIIPNVALSSDFICGFCSETDEEFEDTISLMKTVQYNFCFIFPYSLREKTSAHRKLKDDVPHETKITRLKRMSSVFREIALQINLSKVGEKQLILVEGPSRRSNLQLCGKNDGNIKVIIPDVYLPVTGSPSHRSAVPGDYVEVMITDASSQVLKGTPLKISSIREFSSTSTF